MLMRNKLKQLLAGTAATAALGMTAQAQSSDALIDKLVDKGILTVKEANELREEADRNFTTAFQTKTGMPDWVTNYKLSGDFRGRFDGMFADEMAPVVYSPSLPTLSQKYADRYRLRYRLRIGLQVNMLNDMEVGFRLGSGDGGPLSNNTTLAGNSSKKPVWVDAAYGRWIPVHAGGWNVTTTIGKMDQAFQTTPMVFDPDYTPEGAVGQVSYKFNEQQSLRFIGGMFVLDELQYSGGDPYMAGAQAVWDASWTEKLDTSLGLAVFDIGNKDNLTVKPNLEGSNVAYGNAGNSRELSSGFGSLVYNYNPVVVSGSITYKLDTFPFYNGVFPVKVAGELMHNPGAPRQNEGWWAGITFGKSGVHKTWDLSYRYEYLEADAWYDQLVDDDNTAFYAAVVPGSGAKPYPYNYNDNELTSGNTKGGMLGGTNIKGHMVRLNYSLTDSLTFGFAAYLNSLIVPVPSAYHSDAIHIMGDLLWKF
jgi:Putative porin